MAITEGILVNLGVPASAIKIFVNNLGNTHQEALALQAWAERDNALSIIVPTEIFSARQVRWMLHRAFPSDFGIHVVAVDPPDYRLDGSWWYRQGITAFNTEIIKYRYYILVY